MSEIHSASVNLDIPGTSCCDDVNVVIVQIGIDNLVYRCCSSESYQSRSFLQSRQSKCQI